MHEDNRFARLIAAQFIMCDAVAKFDEATVCGLTDFIVQLFNFITISEKHFDAN